MEGRTSSLRVFAGSRNEMAEQIVEEREFEQQHITLSGADHSSLRIGFLAIRQRGLR